MNKKFISLVILNLATLVLIFLNDPIVQNQNYHNFIDTRSVLGHQNFFDCFSNILFLIFGIIGINYSRVKVLSLSWKIFFISVTLVAFGSYYYHFNPNDQTLVWDRLPMTLAFMSLINAVFFETFKLKYERLSLLILNLIGISSVVVWVSTGDLRFYYWVQLTPIISLLIIGLIFNKELNSKYMIIAFVLYILAKVTEHNDAFFYTKFNFSGHTIKHVLAAFAIYSLYLMKKKQKVNFRRPY